MLKQNKRSTGTETFVYEPSYIEEESLGNLYVIGWLKNHRRDLDFMPNLLASISRREFYKLNGGNAETNFENALKKANTSLAEIVKTNTNAAEDIGICIVNISGDNIRFARIGNIATLLFRDGRITDMSKLSKKSANSTQKAENKKGVFSSVVSGIIYPGDKFMFATEKIIDLFSEKGIVKLFGLNLDNQAEIITEIYQKNQREIPIADQAVILLEVKEQKNPSYLSIPKSIKNRIAAADAVAMNERFAFFRRLRSSAEKIRQAKENLASIRLKIKEAAINLRPHEKNIGILSAAVAGIILLGFGYFSVNAKIEMVKDINSALINSEKIAKNDKNQAIDTLRRAQDIAINMFSNVYLAGTANRLFQEINKKINKFNGVYIDPPAPLAAINANALKFSPQFIFDNADLVYIFGETADMYYKVNKLNKNWAFGFLSGGDNIKLFLVKSAYQNNENIYFTGNLNKSAYVLNLETQELKKTTKINREAANKAKQNFRLNSQFEYYISEDGNKIIRRDLENIENKLTFLLGNNLGNITDFTVSNNANEIFILTNNKIWKLKTSL